jgi:pimeloyl-ACP methyl ester carboxylesterase
MKRVKWIGIYVARHPTIDGIVFLASYPANDALKNNDIRMLSIYGSQDGLTTPQDIEDSRALLPSDAAFVEIKGGNHAQFGSYGLQDGDNQATIAPETQWSQIVDATVALLDTVSE